MGQHRVQAKTSFWICASRAQSLDTSMWNDPPWAQTGICAGQRWFGSLRSCATPEPLLTALQEDQIGQADWGEIGEPVQSQAAPGEDVTGELGTGRNAAEKIPQCLGLYSQQRVENF